MTSPPPPLPLLIRQPFQDTARHSTKQGNACFCLDMQIESKVSISAQQIINHHTILFVTLKSIMSSRHILYPLIDSIKATYNHITSLDKQTLVRNGMLLFVKMKCTRMRGRRLRPDFHHIR